MAFHFGQLVANLLVGVAICTSSAANAADELAADAEGKPVFISKAQQFDFRSKVNRRTYRLMVSVPVEAAPNQGYPTLFVLDGNHFFGTANEAARRQSMAKMTSPAIVVGIGYPTDDLTIVNRERIFDLTPTENTGDGNWPSTGGGAEFAEILEKEIKPFIGKRYQVDRTRQGIWGHSFGGLFVLSILLNSPASYSSYILSSPSIWWNSKEILQGKVKLASNLATLAAPVKVLITSAGDEQYRGSDPQILARSGNVRMIDDATELSDWLVSLGNPYIQVRRVIFDGEAHITVPHPSLSRAVRFGLSGG